MWHAIGQGSDDMFGSWSSTQWRPVDDALAGIWITFFYILHHWGTQVCTYFSRDYVRGIGEYITAGGAIEGRLKKLNIFDEADWPLRYLSTYNGVGNVFGINSGMVDDPALKGIEVPIVDTVEPFIKKYFSRSRWVWRYMRWVDVSPIYTILPPLSELSLAAPAILTDYADTSFMALFGAGKRNSAEDTDYDWDWWNNELVEFTQKLQRFKFRGNNGAAFGKLKSRIKLTTLFDLPEPGVGQGGLFWHQMSCLRVDVDVGGDDEMMVFKYRPIAEGSDTLDYTPVAGTNTLKMRRNRDDYYWFQMIGDLEPEMFMFLLADHMFKVQRRSGSATFMHGTSLAESPTTNMPAIYNLAFSPCALVVFTVEKDEDEGYYLEPLAKTYTFDTLVEPDGYTFFGRAPCVYNWANLTTLGGTGDNFYYSKHELNLTRSDFFAMRSSDPYKKLKHIVYDTNLLDAVAIRNVVSQTYLGTTPAEEVALSAKLDTKPVSQRKDGTDDSTHNNGEVGISAGIDDDSVEKIDDKISSQPISAYPGEEAKKDVDEFAISATPESIKKAEKALKVMKDAMAKQKKKEDAADKAKKAKETKAKKK